MKTYLLLFLVLVGSMSGMMLSDGSMRAICQYIMFGAAALTVFVLVTGVLD